MDRHVVVVQVRRVLDEEVYPVPPRPARVKNVQGVVGHRTPVLGSTLPADVRPWRDRGLGSHVGRGRGPVCLPSQSVPTPDERKT